MGKVSDIIDARLKELGIKGSKMCDDLGISRSTLTELRKGRATTLKAERAVMIANYLGVSVDYLLDGQNLNPCTERSDCTPEVENARRHSRIKLMLALCVLIAAAVVCSILLRHVAAGRTDSSTPISSMEQDNWSNTGSNTDDFSVGW